MGMKWDGIGWDGIYAYLRRLRIMARDGLLLAPAPPLRLDELGQGPRVFPSPAAEVRVAPDAPLPVIQALAVAREPDLAPREVEVEEVLGDLGEEVAADEVRVHLAPGVRHLREREPLRLLGRAQRLVRQLVVRHAPPEVGERRLRVLARVVGPRELEPDVGLADRRVRAAVLQEQHLHALPAYLPDVRQHELAARQRAVRGVEDADVAAPVEQPVEQFVERLDRELVAPGHVGGARGVEERGVGRRLRVRRRLDVTGGRLPAAIPHVEHLSLVL